MVADVAHATALKEVSRLKLVHEVLCRLVPLCRLQTKDRRVIMNLAF